MKYGRKIEISNGPPFDIFSTVRLFKFLIFWLILGFFNTYSPIIFFQSHPNFSKTGVFSVLCVFFLISYNGRPHQFLVETKGFASIEDALEVSALCDLTETHFESFFSIFRFLRGFMLSKVGFLLFPVGEKGKK